MKLTLAAASLKHGLLKVRQGQNLTDCTMKLFSACLCEDV